MYSAVWPLLSSFSRSAVSLAAISGVVIVPGTSYQGPCDLDFACATAHHVAHSMTVNYSGPLFQLDNGSTTLDIGQTAGHIVDMTTWSAFCGGVQANCKYSKFYDHIRANANDLVPSQINNGQTNCSPTPTTCAAPFKIEAATGLPVVELVQGQEYVLGATDAASTGINSGTNPLTVLMNFKLQQTPACCGQYGADHIWSERPFVFGRDFELFQSYDTSGFCPAGQLCLGVDMEGGNPPLIPVVNAVAGDNAIYSATYGGSGTNNVTLYYNGTQFNSGSYPSQNTGDRIHFGGGGDLTQPANIIWRGGLFANAQLSAAQNLAVFNIEKALFPTLTFGLF